jgi:[acyl-carrier-protein] S-malonyltransferase
MAVERRGSSGAEPSILLNRHPTAIVFDGQGTHWYGMAKDIYDRHDVVKDIFEAASDAVGVDMAEACFNEQAGLLEDTQIAQPAIATNSLAELHVWLETNEVPDVIGGLSLGLYVAAGVSAIKGALTTSHLEADYKIIKMVAERAKIMYEVSIGKDGIMVPCVGLDRETIDGVIKNTDVKIGVIVDSKVVTLTGPQAAMKQILTLLSEKGGRPRDPLKVPLAAHHELQRETISRLGPILRTSDIGQPTIKLAANMPLYLKNREQIIMHLLEQMVDTADWKAVEDMLVIDGIRRVAQFGSDRRKNLARQMAKNHKQLGVEALNLPTTA